MSVRVLSNSDGTQRMKNMYIMFKGFRTPKDADSNEKDSDGKIITRDLRRMYFEEYEITQLDDNGVNIGGLNGQLHYQDEGSGTATSVSKLIFPISNAYGIWKNYKNGHIVWNYNNSGLFLRKLIVNPPGNDVAPWTTLSEEVAVTTEQLTTVIGTTENILDGSKTIIRTQQTNLGKLVADSTLWFARKYISDKSLDLEVDLALKHAGGFIKSILGPNITRLDIGSALIYNDLIVIVQLDAKELVATIENAVSRYPTPDGRYLQTSGISIEFDKMVSGVEGRSTMDQPSRVIEMSVKRANGDIDVIVKNGTIQGDATRLFGVAINNYMFAGGDGYSAFPVVSNNSARKVILTNVGEQTILEQYITEEIEDKKVNLPVILSESVFIGTSF